jgi:hypothetical protein
MKTLSVTLVLTLVQIVFGSPLEEFDDFESAPLKTRCNKIDKTDRLPLDADGARRCIDGWRNGENSDSFEKGNLTFEPKGNGLVRMSMANSCHVRINTGYEITICGKIQTAVGTIAKIASTRQLTRISLAFCV